MPDVAASGPVTGNASEPRTGFPLDQAISTALDGLNRGGDGANGASPGDDIADELTNPEVAKLARNAQQKGRDDAGDSRDGEDAQAAAGRDKGEAKAVGNDDAKVFEAPKHWPAADKEAFAALAPEAQTLIHRLARDLEGGFTRRSQEQADRVKFAERVSGLFDDRTRAQLRQAGTDEAGAIQYLMGLQRFATENPTGYIKWAMQSLGVTPQTLDPQMSPAAGKDGTADPQQQQQPTGDQKLDELLADPAVKQLRTELSEAKQVIADIYGRMSARERQEYDYGQEQQRAAEQQLVGVMRGFRTQQDDNGQLAYPHFEAVAQQMGALMDSRPYLIRDAQGRVLGMRDNAPEIVRMPDGPEKMKLAYDMAIWARPDLRSGLVEAEAGRRLAQADKKREAERAKRATAVRPAQGSPTQKARTSGIDDAILGAFSKLSL